MSDREAFEKSIRQRYPRISLTRVTGEDDYCHSTVSIAYRSWLSALEHCKQGNPILWTCLTPEGKVAYFDGKPMYSTDENEIHTVPLFRYTVSNDIAPQPPTDNDHVAEGCELFPHAMPRSDGVIFDGGELWEILFSVFEGDVPEQFTVDKTTEVALWINRVYVAPTTPQPSTDVSDAQLESIIENSGGHWVEDEFRVNGADLMNMLRAIAKHTVK